MTVHNLKFKDVGAVWRVRPCVFEPEEMEDVYNLPGNWQSLDWHRAEQVPCLDGDDLLLALDEEKGVGYMVFDSKILRMCAACQAHDWPVSEGFEAFARKACLDPWQDDEDESE